MWILYLNDMRASNVEIVHPVARAETREALQAFVAAETIGTWYDGHWNKRHRQGGPLEWYNPPWSAADYREVGPMKALEFVELLDVSACESRTT